MRAKPPPSPKHRVDLGDWHCAKGDFHLELVVTRSKLSHLIAKAMENRDGRTALAAGGIVLLAKRTAPAPRGTR